MAEIGIGAFAGRPRLPVKALRPYDELGVLAPAHVDDASGYRCYDTGQLESARLVSMLRQLALPLAGIKDLLACDPVDAADRRPAWTARSATCRSPMVDDRPRPGVLRQVPIGTEGGSGWPPRMAVIGVSITRSR